MQFINQVHHLYKGNRQEPSLVGEKGFLFFLLYICLFKDFLYVTNSTKTFPENIYFELNDSN